MRRHIDSRKASGNHFTETIILNWLLQLLNALSYIHAKNVIHRDIKPENVFLDANAMVKIGDFGVSKILDSTIHSITTAGSHCYMSPEIVEGKKYKNKTDVWSLGCVMWELASLRRPFAEKKFLEIHRRILEDEAGSIPKFYSGLLQIVINKMLIKDQDKRPSIKEFLMDGKILEIMTLITKSSHLKESQLKEELALSVNLEQEKYLRQEEQGDMKKNTIFKILESAKKEIGQKLEAMRKGGAKAKHIEEFEGRVKEAFEELAGKVQRGFEKLQSERNFSGSSENPFEESSLDTETIRSVLLGHKTLKDLQIEDQDRMQGSELSYSQSQFGTILSREADVNGLTVKGKN